MPRISGLKRYEPDIGESFGRTNVQFFLASPDGKKNVGSTSNRKGSRNLVSDQTIDFLCLVEFTVRTDLLSFGKQAFLTVPEIEVFRLLLIGNDSIVTRLDPIVEGPKTLQLESLSSDYDSHTIGKI